MRDILTFVRDFQIAMLRGRALHLRALAADYDSQAAHCRRDATQAEAKVVQMEVRRLLTRQALREL
jgi:hypothetical protein